MVKLINYFNYRDLAVLDDSGFADDWARFRGLSENEENVDPEAALEGSAVGVAGPV